MKRPLKRKLEAFRRAQARAAKYHISQSTPHDQAIREHKAKGYGMGLERGAGLLDQRNKI